MAKILKLWLITQDVNDDYDTYDSAVVVAESAEDARMIVPGNRLMAWTYSDNVEVIELGTAIPGLEEGEVICASFNAG